MKFAKLLQLSVVIVFLGHLVSAQSAPNLENGFKPYGSYDGSNMDTINLQNGNLMLHIPVYPEAPQRGKMDLNYLLYVTSKNWAKACTPSPCAWTLLAASPDLENGWEVTSRRTVNIDSSSGQTIYTAAGYSIVTGDGGNHQLYAIPGNTDASGQVTKYQSIDGTGYHLDLSNPDPTSGLLNNAVITDRHGTQYLSTFSGGKCTNKPPPPFLNGSGYAGMVDNYPLENGQTCSERSHLNQTTDSNGNTITLQQLGSNTQGYDTMGRISSPWGTATQTYTDPSNCPTSLSFAYAWTVTYTGANGETENVKLCYGNVSYASTFTVSGVTETSGSGQILTALIRADGSKWTFAYDNFVNVQTITLPTGGSITYGWGTRDFTGTGSTSSRVVISRTLTDNNGHSYQWQYNWGSLSNLSFTNVVTDPLGNDTAHVFTNLGGGNTGYFETSTINYQGLQSVGHLLRRVDTAYGTAAVIGTHLGNVFPTSIQTTIYPSNKVNLVTKAYDAGLGAGAPIFGNVVTEKQYDWGPGAPGVLLRETDTTYQWQINGAYLTAQLPDLPASVIIKDGSGCALSEIDYSYDESAYLTSYESNVGALPTGTHIAAPAAVHGNLTSVAKWLAPASSCSPKSGSQIVSHTNWYDTGEAFQQIDPLGHTTTHTYDPFYAGAYASKTCSPSTAGVTHCVSGTYDFATGLLTSLTNENATAQASGNTFGDSAHSSSYSYDSMLRLTSAQAPPDPANGAARAQTSFNFSAPTAFPFNVQRTKSITASLTDSATSFFDGLGRGYKSQHVLPGGISTVDTTLDFAGHPANVSNPYFTTSDPTYGAVTSLFDGLGRAYSVTRQDGSISSVAYNVITGAHDAVIGAKTVGDCTDTTDEAGKQRRTCMDALGRLVQVVEPNPGASATDASGSVVINGSEQSSTQSGASGSAQVTISGGENATVVCPLNHCHTIYDSGNVSITANGYNKTVTYGQGSTPSTVAVALRDAFHNDPSSPVDASCSDQSCSNPVITLTARTQGTATNYSLACSSSANDSADFTPPSFHPACPAAMAGGRDPITTPDSGSVTITVNGTGYSTTYGGGDTTATIAQRLASAISAGTLASGSAGGSTVTITTKTGGNGTNYSLAASYAWNNNSFTNPSFTTSTSGSVLTGGYDAGVLDNQPYVTLYQYDGLGNLLRVDQKGSAPSDSTQWRTRTFTYDSLSRLLTANNPESGTITYSYDADGELLQKTSPAPNQTGSATQTVSYCYDALHRVTGKGYGAQSCPLATPVVTYAYDSGTNAKGHLTSLADQAGTASYSYDILGRLATETRAIAGISKSTSYTYNLNGSVKTLTYPSGRVVTYTPDSAGRLVSAGDGNGTNYVTSASYNPDSSLKSLLNGSVPVLNQNFQYTPRLQLCRITTLTSGTLPTSCTDSQHIGNIMDRSYDFHIGNGTAGSGTDNGNVFAITNYRDTTRSQAFTYDALNRLSSGWSSANTGTYSWGENYSIDAWGNLQISPMGGKAHGGTFALSGNAQNRPTGMAYDAAGNLMSYLSATYTYDQENRLASTAGMTYTYDANGERVLKSNTSTGEATKRYWSMGGNTLAEGDVSENLTAEYVYFGGKRVARIDLPANTVHYYLSDHLGSTSVVASASGAVEEESDYYPFGTEVVVSGPGANELKFTGKRRDTESQLDYFGARYYSNVFGRFSTADLPFADQHKENPQTWNLYAYGRNNPLGGIDPNGRGYIDIAALVQSVKNWWNGGVARDGGVGNFAKNNGIGAAKGTGAFGFNTAKTGVALGQAANLNIPGAVSTMMTPLPKPLQPSNQTQAQASTATQITLTVATAAIPLGGAETAATLGTTSLFRAVGTAEAESIETLGAFSAAPNGTMFKGFFFNQSDADSFGQMATKYGEESSVYSTEAPANLVNSSPPHSAAGEGPGTLIPNEELHQLTPPKKVDPQ
jgi:RHS repeat-associated protein